MIVLHKAQRIDNGEEVKGFLNMMWGEYHIVKVDNENKAYPVKEETIKPCLNAGNQDIDEKCFKEAEEYFYWKMEQGNIESDYQQINFESAIKALKIVQSFYKHEKGETNE